MRSADVVVVGAGVVGASCAYHLARAGLRTLLLDRAKGPGAGSTGRATGGFRAQYGSELNVRLSLLSRAKLHAFREDTGVDPGFDPVGYLFLAQEPAHLDALREAHALQQRLGLTEARVLTAEELPALNPHLRYEGLLGGTFCPSDGVLRPLEILRGYLEASARAGAEHRWDEELVALERGPAGRLVKLRTRRGTEFSAGLVLDAAGPWAASVARLAGEEIPVVPLRRQVALTEPTRALPERFPLTIWLGDGFHLRVRDGRALLLRPSPGNPEDPWDDRVEPAWLDDVAARAAERVPPLRGVSLDRERSWAGLYELSPDGHALLGFAPGCPNLLLANGSSGHGVMHSPALGQLATEIAVYGETRSLDARALRPSRFAEGEPVQGSALL